MPTPSLWPPSGRRGAAPDGPGSHWPSMVPAPALARGRGPFFRLAVCDGEGGQLLIGREAGGEDPGGESVEPLGCAFFGG